MQTLDTIPYDIIGVISKFLSSRDQGNLRETSKKYARLIKPYIPHENVLKLLHYIVTHLCDAAPIKTMNLPREILQQRIKLFFSILTRKYAAVEWKLGADLDDALLECELSGAETAKYKWIYLPYLSGVEDLALFTNYLRHLYKTLYF